MPRLTKKEKEEIQLQEELNKLKEEKIMNFIYDTLKQNDFSDKRIIRHITKRKEGTDDLKYEMILFVYENPQQGKKYENDDFLILYRFSERGKWQIINFHGTEIVKKFSKEMFYEIVYEVQNEN
ncbi:hypothetical protein HNQ80_001162 [Anaerosolibacter carboniphilus]|uniref:Uncharacterized protein n=1 Tax=Anaerosolibacter carboniphilus TaxID=1417629 RepID=A0A841KNU3_9FIRM|nr:hypothetical protein [Anaerosolibacter carboniphilus]MBB6215073.1 hypothetical protein [Anaerosolibacter carboniphilus]